MGSVLVINSGSSSLKFKLFTSAAQKLSAAVTGLVERIGDTANSQLVVSNRKSDPQGGKQTFQVRIRVSATARASHLAQWPPLPSVHSSVHPVALIPKVRLPNMTPGKADHNALCAAGAIVGSHTVP